MRFLLYRPVSLNAAPRHAERGAGSLPATRDVIPNDVKNPAFGGVQSDDIQVSDRQVAYWVNDTRDLLVGQLLSSGKAIPESIIQHLECVKLDCIDPAECCDISSTKRVLRSTQKLPRLLS